MEVLNICMDADNAWPDLKSDNGPPVHQAAFKSVALMENGTVQGKPTVWVRLEMPDGSVILAQTTAALFVSAAKAFHAKHPNLLD